MKIYILDEKYKFDVEQTAIMLMPEREPRVTVGLQPVQSDGSDYGTVDVLFSDNSVLACCTLVLDGEKESRSCRAVKTAAHTEQSWAREVAHTVRRSVYRTFVILTGQKPAWGSLAGVRPGKLARGFLESGMTPKETLSKLENGYYIRKDKAALALKAAEVALELKAELTPNDIALYIDVPFCPSRCAYCSFISRTTGVGEGAADAYLDALEREIAAVREVIKNADANIKAVYIGGGTPTSLTPAQLSRMLTALDSLEIPSGCEYTLEAGRPDTITAERLEAVLGHGVTRVSVNPQTFSQKVLDTIGRNHSVKEVSEAVELVRRMTDLEINMDLIAGLPGESTAVFAAGVLRASDLDPDNITVHTLALKRGSDFALRMGKQTSPEALAVMVEGSATLLKQQGYEPYYLYRQKYMNGSFENVGYAREGKICRYNVYMMDELLPVIALGCGGSTKITREDKGRFIRITNPKYPEEYISRIDEIVDKKRRIELR